jgi:TRAP transporter TAXI family solute receptor
MSRVGWLITAVAASALLCGCAILWYTSRPTLPPEIRIAAGRPGGLYHTFAQDFAKRLEQRTGRPVRVVETTGTEANVGLLRDGGADLALIQTTSLTPEGVVGVAPLFPEPLHFLVRKGKAGAIGSPAGLAGKRVALGVRGSGMLQNAHTVLAHYGVSPGEVVDVGNPFDALADETVDAVLITTGWMNPSLEKVLGRGDAELVGLADPEGLAARHPWFVPTTIPRGLYAGRSPVPRDPVPTVAATALMTARSDAPDDLVREALAALYDSDLRAAYPAVLSARAARDYDAAVMHPGVAAYHDPSARINRLSRALELATKSKEAVFGAGALALLIWGGVRRRRERIAAAADGAQKQKLDEFIGRTLSVELEQMEVSDPEQLRFFLRQVTRIKQDALQELTSEKVRGDQLFAIFLSQCAALSEKIQMRMIYGRLSQAQG